MQEKANIVPNRIPVLQKEVSDLKEVLRKKDSTIRHLNNVVANLRKQLESKPQKIHNERGAGRKSKITTEMVAEVMNLRHKNLSIAEIAKVYSQNSDNQISKSSVYKIIKKRD